MGKVQSYLKKTLKVISWVILSFVIIFIIIAFLIQIPVIQNKIIHYATTYVSNKTHTRVEIKNISISFPKSVVIEGLYLEDLKKDTLLYAGKAKVNIVLYDLLFSKIAINSISMEDVNLKLNNTKNDSLFNYNYVLTSFIKGTKQPVVNPPATSKWTFSIKDVSMKNIRLQYDDEYGGVNVSAVLKNSKFSMNEFNLDKSIYRFDELLMEGITANVLLKKSNNQNTQSGSDLPEITARKLQLNNSTINYIDSTGNQSVVLVISHSNLKKASIDVQKQLVTSDYLYLSKSKIQYHTFEPELSSGTSKAVPISPSVSNWKVSVNKVMFDDDIIVFKTGNKPQIQHVFDPNNQEYNHAMLEATSFKYSSDQTAISIRKFSAIDQNNFAISHLETDFSMDQHSITAKKLKASTTYSSIDGDLSLHYSSSASLRDSMQYNKINLNLRNLSFRNSEVLYFKPDLIKQPFFKNRLNVTIVSGIFKGQMNNLNAKNLLIHTGNSTILKTDFNIKGLPEFQTASYNFPNLSIISGRKDIEMMAGPSIPKSIELPEHINLQIVFKGKIKSFESTLGMKSSFGAAQLFATIDKDENFRSNVDLTNFDLGSLLKNKVMYGPVTLAAEINGQGLDKNTIKARIKAEASQIYLNTYTYHNLNLEGNINGQSFEGKINLNDPNVVFDLEGLANLNPNQEQKFKFRLNVQGADLQKLNLTKDDIRIGLIATADFQGDMLDKMKGKAGITNIILNSEGKKYMLDSLFFASINEPNVSELNFSSALIGIKYSGTTSPDDLTDQLDKIINNYFPFADSSELKEKNEPSNFNLVIQLHNHPILAQVLLPQLKEFEPGIIHASFDSQKKDLRLNATMKKIVYGTVEIQDFALDVKSGNTALNYKISSSAISTPQIRLDNFLLDGKLADNKIFTNISSTDGRIKKLLIHSQITKDNTNYKLMLDPKEFYLMNNRWDIAADNFIEFGKQGVLFHHLALSHAESQINITSLHDKFADDLNIAFKNFRLDDISRIIEKDSSLVKGNVNGNVLLKRVNNTYGIEADARISDLKVHDIPIGILTVKAENPRADKFDIALNLLGPDNNLTSNGYFIPNGGDNSISMKTVIQSLSLKTIEAFSMKQLTEAAGTLTGNFLIEGRTDAPDITGELVFNNAFFKPAVLNNRLELKHETIQLKKEGLYFKSFTLLDAGQHTAIIDGTVQMKQFSNFIFALQVNTKDFLLFNSTPKNNKEFFGRMIIDSKIDVNGPIKFPVVNARVKVKKGSNFTFSVPEDKLSTDRGEDVVEFEDSLKINPILNRPAKKGMQASGITGVDLTSIIEIDKEATLRLLMDPTSADSLVVKGEAALSFTMDQSGKMSLTGAYNLNDGSYMVTFESVIRKKFTIDAGSTIIWNGDPLNADISINARYSVRASPYDLVADQVSGLSDVDKSGYKQRYPFLVLLKLRGKILSPAISFEIQLSPENKGILGGAVDQKLSMLNEDESTLNKQVFALLVLGRFVQENPFQTQTSGVASNLIRSTVGKFLSAQLNQMSSKMLPGMELNFDIQSYNEYQTGQANGRTQVGIGVKKQLFNDQLSVQLGGSVDVEGSQAKQNSASNITSDVTVEYKLNKDGSFRMKGFRHNQYEGAIQGQLIETGVGVVYVRDFNLWKRLFKSKKNRTISLQKQNSEPKTELK